MAPVNRTIGNRDNAKCRQHHLVQDVFHLNEEEEDRETEKAQRFERHPTILCGLPRIG